MSRACQNEIDRLVGERDQLRERLSEAEAVVYGLCDAWDGDMPKVDDPGGVVFGVWLESAGYHAKYRMGLSPVSDDGQESGREDTPDAA